MNLGIFSPKDGMDFSILKFARILWYFEFFFLTSDHAHYWILILILHAHILIFRLILDFQF